MILSRVISKNTIWLFSGQVSIKAISFFYTIFLARSLGVGNFGLYVAALTYFGLIGSFADFGFNRFLMRDLSIDRSKASQYLSNIFVLRTLMTSVAFLLFLLFILSFDHDLNRVKISILAVFAIIPNSLALSLDSTLIAFEKMRQSSLAIIILNAATAIFGAIAIFLGFSVMGVVLGLILAHFVYVIALILLLKRGKVSFGLSFDFDFWKKAITSSLPYAIIIILSLIYFKIDALMLTYLKGESATGYYGAAYKFLEAIYFIPMTILTALFPKIAKLHLVDKNELRKTYIASLRTLFLVSIPITLALFWGANLLIQYLYGSSFAPAVLALQILAFATIFLFSNAPAVHFLLASEKFLKSIILAAFGTVIFNIVLNFILIPQYGFLGAAISTVASEIVSFFVFFFLIFAKVFDRKDEQVTV